MRSLKRLFGYLGPYWRPLLVTAILLLLQTGLSLLPPLFQRQIVDEVIGAGDLGRLGVVVAAMIGVYALLAGVSGATNAITYVTDLLGEVTLVGPGAGRRETGFALLADLLEIDRA